MSRFCLQHLLLLVFLSFLLPAAATAVPLPCGCYGTQLSERALSIAAAADSGWFVAGYTTMATGGPADTNLLVFKVKPNGAVSWARTTGPIPPGNFADVVQSVAATADGGCVIAGWTRNLNPPSADIFVVKLAADGNLMWGQTFGRGGDDKAMAVIPTADGGYAVTGYSELGGIRQAVVLKLNGTGTPIWARNYLLGSDWTEGLSICEVPSPLNPSYVVCGRFKPFSGLGTTNAFVMKVDALNGNLVWPAANQPVITSAASSTEAWSVAYDGKDIIVAGWSGNWGAGGSLSDNILLWKLSPAGVTSWARVYGWDLSEEKAMGERCLVVDSLRGYTVAGWTNGAGPGVPNFNMLALKVEPVNGNPVWSRVHPSQPGAQDEKAFAIVRDTIRYAIAGYTNSPWAIGQDDAHFVTLDTNGNRPVCVIDTLVLASLNIGAGFSVITSVIETYAMSVMTVADFGVSRVDICPEIRDGGSWRIFAPTDTIDSTQTVAPACSVHNHGNFPIDIPVTISIGATMPPFYVATETVFGLAPGTGARVTFPAYSDWPRGRHLVIATTTLDGDTNLLNNVALDSVFVRVRDVSVEDIVAPTDTIDSTQLVAPVVTVGNQGNVPETFGVTFDLANYNATQTVSALPGERLTISFGAFDGWQRGDWTATASAIIPNDVRPDDNTLTQPVMVRVRDVGATALVAPADGAVIDSGTVITPACSVANFGNVPASFWARLRIGAYRESLWVSDLGPGDRIEVGPFPDWTATTVGVTPLEARTIYSPDLVPNDSVTGHCVVRRPGGHDVGCSFIVRPTGTVDSGAVITPACSVRNYGSFTESYFVVMDIGGPLIYRESVWVSNHPAGVTWEVTFPNWVASPTGVIVVSCSTRLAGDNTPEDDRQVTEVRVLYPRPDVGCTRVLVPAGHIPLGRVIAPVCSLYNYGNTTESYRALVRIGTVYDCSVDVVNHAPGSYQQVVFPTWAAGPAGLHSVVGITLLGTDTRRSNDTARTWLAVRAPAPAGWVELNPVPLDNSNKPVGDGGWLVYNRNHDRFFAAKGNKTEDFYCFDPVGGGWTLRNPYERGREDRPPAKGSGATTDGDNYIYTAKGNNTSKFYRYSISGDSWLELESIPLGVRRRKLKGGTAMAYVDYGGQQSVYLAKGSGTLEFYRYDITADTWQELPGIPVGRGPKIEYGSWLVFDGTMSLYLHKARYHELWRFDLATGRWDTSRMLTGMPLTNRYGRTRKSKEGGCATYYAGDIYSLKGANSQDFFRYRISRDSWTELESLPSYSPVTRKRRLVKGGAGIAARADGIIYALKGNKTREFWRYTPTTDLYSGRPQADGVTQHGPLADEWRLIIAPNPLRSGILNITAGLPGRTATISLFDPLGRRVLIRQLVGTGSGPMALDLRQLPAGVYLVRLESSNNVLTRKLVIEH